MKGGYGIPLAIVGVGCRLPGGVRSPDDLWRLIERGGDAIGSPPPGRAALAAALAGNLAGRIDRPGGWIEDVDAFDAGFFGISPREARRMDPQQRLLLEVTHEALEDGGIAVAPLAGSRTGVWVGLWSGEYEHALFADPDTLDFHGITGGGRYAASGRIAWALDLRGPAITLDTGCSAGLVALDAARAALAHGEVDAAIVAAANLILQPHVTIGYERAGMLSKALRCRFGARDAGGYVRSDGVVALVVKTLERATADGDPIRAVVLGTAVNADGRGSGQLATPSTEAQAELLRTAYARAGVDPSTIAFVEAHGTGTRAGDPVELGALGRVLGEGRAEDRPLLVGSIKSNIGHTEAVAGLAGMLKTTLVLEHGLIPPSLHAEELNPEIDWDGLNVRVVREPWPWPDGSPRIAGVSAFGITGTNAHVVLAAPEPTPARPAERPGDRIVVLSARDESALADARIRLRDHLDSTPDLRLDDLSFTTTCRRDHHEHRIAFVASSVARLRQALETDDVAASGVVSGEAPRVGFVFSGQGSQWRGMASELLRHAPAFARTVEECETALARVSPLPLRRALLGELPQADAERVEIVQPAIAVFQIALARQLMEWGIAPAAVAGHSMGEVAAACIAGALPLDDAMRIIAMRSARLSSIAGLGAMALLDLEAAATEERIRSLGLVERLAIAAINGPRTTVVSGDVEAVGALIERCTDEDIFCRRIGVDVASHSPQTDALLPALRDDLHGMDARAPVIPMHSTVTGGELREAPGVTYWLDNLRRPVRLHDAIRSMLDADTDILVEIAPHPVLLSSLADAMAGAGVRVRAFAGPRREEPARRRLLELLARLHCEGVTVNWRRLASPDARPVRLPAYPWRRQRYWIEPVKAASRVEAATPLIPAPASPSAISPAPTAPDAVWRIAWEETSLSAPGMLRGRWVIVADRSGVAEALAAGITASGGDAVVVRDAASLRSALAATQWPAGIVHLRAIDAAADGGVAAFGRTLDEVCDAALDTIDALYECSHGRGISSWWVTRGVQSAGGRTAAPVAVPQAAQSGIARALRADDRRWDPRIVDLPAGAPPSDAARRLLAVLGSATTETELAFTDDGRAFAPRLVSHDLEGRDAATPVDGAWLITGGTGGVGLHAAEVLAARGARTLVLAARTALPPRNEWPTLRSNDPARHAIERIRALEAAGKAVHTVSVDVADESALDEALERLHSAGVPRVTGIVHCAGTLESGLTEKLDRTALRRVLHGKAGGAWTLNRLLSDVDTFLSFSSVSALLPAAGQAAYAAANAVLDALAGARRGEGRHALSLGWGVWAGTGMLLDARTARSAERMAEEGLPALDPAQGRALFAAALEDEAAHLVLARIDRERFGRAGIARFGSLVAGFAPRAARTESLGQTLRRLPSARQRGVLEERLLALLAEVLEVDVREIQPEVPLGRQGLDSLMGLELRNRLETEFDLTLPASLAWNHPTVHALAAHLLERLEVEGANSAGHLLERLEGADSAAHVNAAGANGELVEENGSRAREVLAEVSALSESDVLRALRTGAR